MSDGRSYYGQPILKEPVWSWEIPCYFYAGGLAGASAGLAFLCEVRGNDELARRAWLAALAGLSVSPALLTADLGKPTRFLNMLRMFKVTSPMSVGSWILSGSGAATALAALNAWTGRLPRAGAAAKPAAALLGLPLATYTAALVTNTAIPVWHEARVLLPYVFASGAAPSAGAAGVALTPPESAGPAWRLALGGTVLELACRQVMKTRLGQHAEPYHVGQAGKLSRLSEGCLVAGAGLLATQGRSSRAAAAAAGALLTAGALAVRWSTFKAGFQSAADPKYVVEPQRRAIERGERRGGARTEPRLAAGDSRGA